MTEADILAQLQTSRYNLSVIAGQLIGVNFALIAAVYYFLHRAGIILKIIAFALYTAGYFALLILFAWENIHLDGIEYAIFDLVNRKEATVVANTLQENWAVGRSGFPDLLVGFVIIASWLAIGFLMFFYKFKTEK